MSAADQMIFAALEEAEEANPPPFKIDGDGQIYCSRYLDLPEDVDLPILTDLGNAYIDSPNNNQDCQPWQYRAPEVILKMPRSYGIGI